MIRLLLIALLALPTAALAAQQKSQQQQIAPPPKCRDAKTGQYVTTAHAKKYPGLTVCEARK